MIHLLLTVITFVFAEIPGCFRSRAPLFFLVGWTCLGFLAFGIVFMSFCLYLYRFYGNQLALIGMAESGSDSTPAKLPDLSTI